MVSSALRLFAKRCGFERFSYLQTTGAKVETYNNYPSPWQRAYLNRHYSRIDPVVSEAKRRMSFFEWTAGSWSKRRLSHEERQFQSEAIQFGLCSGITIPVEGSFGSVLMLTFATSKMKPDLTAIGDCQRAEIALLALHYRLREIAASKLEFSGLELTPTEASCLAWIAKGKTMKEIAASINPSARTVQQHLDRARKKLGATRLPHAVGIAKDHRLI